MKPIGLKSKHCLAQTKSNLIIFLITFSFRQTNIIFTRASFFPGKECLKTMENDFGLKRAQASPNRLQQQGPEHTSTLASSIN